MDSSPSVASYYSVHLGRWTDWSRGPVFGATITLTQSNGTLLVAFIALFITLVGTSFWRISCYLLHHLYSTESARDGLHHQRQAILRNSANSANGLLSLLQALLAWKNIAKRPYRRTIPLLLLTALSLGAFAVASGFSSKVSSALGNEVLVQGSNCGKLMLQVGAALTDAYMKMAPYLADRITTSTNYALQCYTNTPETERCRTYVRPQLPFSIQTNASCPFNETACLSQDRNLILDSGLIDTHDDLGINAPPNERLQVRLVDHCAPINVTGRQGRYNYTSGGSEQWYRTYYLGESVAAEFTYKYPETNTNQIFANAYGTSAPADYTIGSLEAAWDNETYHADSQFLPIPELTVPHADLDLLFLSATGVISVEQCEDPWFSAKRYAGFNLSHSSLTNTAPVYIEDEPVSVLGCVSQMQWCNRNLPEDQQCEPLRGKFDTSYYRVDDGKENRNSAWLEGIALSNLQSISDLVGGIGASVLRAKATLFNGIQGPLPDNQWQLEVQHWFAVKLAGLQAAYVDTATGPSDTSLRSDTYVVYPKDSEERNICQNQKVRSTAYMNFSLFGIIIIFALGGLIIIVSYALEPFAAWLQRKRNLDSYSRLEWCTNETLQLQRLANEELGVGEWNGTDETIPVTDKDDYLAVLDLTDPKHPRLKQPPRPYDDTETKEPAISPGDSSIKDVAEMIEEPRDSPIEEQNRPDRISIPSISENGDGQL